MTKTKTYNIAIFDGDGCGSRLWQYDETVHGGTAASARKKAREILDRAASACEREDGYSDGDRLEAHLEMPNGSTETFALTLTEEHLGEIPEESPYVDRSRFPNRDTIGESADDWWSALGYSTGLDRDWSHPICTFEEIDTLDGDTAVPEEFAEALAAGGERAEDARESIADLVAYGQRAKAAAVTIRDYLDAAIDAAWDEDGDALIEALEAASREEREWGDDPSTRKAADKLLAPGWSLDGGRVVRDED